MSVTVEPRAAVGAHPVEPLLRDHPAVTVRLGRNVPTAGFTQYLWVSGPDQAALVEAALADVRLLAATVGADEYNEDSAGADSRPQTEDGAGGPGERERSGGPRDG